ncbi:MAG: FAD-linked oxidase C-terminal domain-containing protein [Syntrophotaleaceae bacterium]
MGVPSVLAPFIVEGERARPSPAHRPHLRFRAGSGNLHLRPLFDITLPGLAKRVQTLADDIYRLVLRHGGTITAEHGMGRLRAPYPEQEWGSALYGYMRRLKTIFDPQNLLNLQVMFSDRR